MKPKRITKNLYQYRPGLYLVDLDLPLTGFRQFISCWIYQKEGHTLVIDPGPTATVPFLVRALKKLDVRRIDYLLLTHIHLDHGGGTGALLKHFPDTPVNCHPKGIPHLIDPERLWQGSLNVLGKIAHSYGAVQPVKPELLSYQTQIRTGRFTIDVIETPGHAAHHVNYLVDDLLFVAETAGVSISAGDGFYQRIATPPRFIYNVYKASLQKAAQIPARLLCLGHYGVRSDPGAFFKTADDQLEFWLNALEDHLEKEDVYDEQALLKQLLHSDPALRLFPKMERDIQKRELYFCRNSLQGMYRYLSEEE